MIKGIVCDIGGVLYQGDTPIKGAIETINHLQQSYPLLFLTNTTRTTPHTLWKKLTAMGFVIKEEMIFSALRATKEYIFQKRAKGVYTLLTNEAKEYFKELESNTPDFVIVGDAHYNFTYENMNRAFRHILQGAKLIAAAKNRYFKDSDNQLSLDAGGFITALEYAANTQAKLIGKPNKEFFLLACSVLELEPHEVLMIGDDIEADILGAKQAGLKTALVQTGKFTPKDLEKGIKPDFIIKDISKVATILSS